MVNAKKKGNAGENNFANWLRAGGVKAFKEVSSGGHTVKGDVTNDIDYTIEVKTVKKLNIQDAWKQVTLDSQKAQNRPLLAIHYDGMPKDEWMIVLHSNDWLDLELGEVDAHNIYDDPKKKWRLKALVEAGKQVLKDFDV